MELQESILIVIKVLFWGAVVFLAFATMYYRKMYWYLNDKIKGVKKDLKESGKDINRWMNLYNVTVAQWEQSNSKHMTARMSQGIEIERLKKELRNASVGTENYFRMDSIADEFKQLLESKDLLEANFKVKCEAFTELKESFARVVTDLRHKTDYYIKVEKDNVQLSEMYAKVVAENDVLKERCRKMDARIGHKKYVPESEQKGAESDWWTPKRNIKELFIEGVAYRKRDAIYPNGSPTLIHLWSGDKSYQVAISDFYPCNSFGKVAKGVVKHEPEIFTIG